mmetsp:Transcript_77648/g.125942  ORF Transcript_77648/g.125942 Transcript_77648/m.125942 type:complete len:86 (+) Transcript_77648:210-467(+)
MYMHKHMYLFLCISTYVHRCTWCVLLPGPSTSKNDVCIAVRYVFFSHYYFLYAHESQSNDCLSENREEFGNDWESSMYIYIDQKV